MTAGFLKTSRSFDEVISNMSQKTVHVRALRGFVLTGRQEPVKPGDIVEVSLLFARELVGANQAERFDPNDPANKPASQTLTTRADALPAESAPRAARSKDSGGTK